MRRALLALSGIVICAGLVTALAANARFLQERVPGTIRVRVTLVPIDIIVTDKDDRPVTNLRQEDFTVIEDGVRQNIAHFSFQALTAIPVDPSAPTKALLRKIPVAELTPETRRTFLIVLGRGRLQHPSRGIDGLLTFVRKDLLPQDLVAVLAYNRATDFTTDHEKVAQVLERFRKYHEGIESKMALHFSGLGAIYGGRDIPKSLQPEIAKVFDASGAIGSRQVPPGGVADGGQMTVDTREVTDTLQRAATREAAGDSLSPLERVQADALTDLPFDEFVSANRQTMQDLQNLYTAIEYLRYMEGEKHLLFFTENGLFLPRLDNDQSLAAMANDARVTIDTFQTGGVAMSNAMSAQFSGLGAESSRIPGRGGARGGGGGRGGAMGGGGGRGGQPASFSQMFALASLRNISRLTGGRSSIHASVPDALSRLNEVTRSEYLLGYYPTNGDWNGKYRKLTVRVNRPDLKLYYRRGYYGRQSLQPFDRKAFLSYSRISSAAQYEEEVKDIGVQVRVHVVPTASGDGREVQVDVVLQAPKIPFTEGGGRHVASVQVVTFYGDSRGRFLGESWQQLDLNLREETWQRVQKDGIPFSTRVPYQVPDQTFKVVVYSYDADKVGSVTTRLR